MGTRQDFVSVEQRTLITLRHSLNLRDIDTQFQKSMPTSAGFGYRMRAYAGNQPVIDAGLSYQTT